MDEQLVVADVVFPVGDRMDGHLFVAGVVD